jgi:hypothetical protein
MVRCAGKRIAEAQYEASHLAPENKKTTGQGN